MHDELRVAQAVASGGISEMGKAAVPIPLLEMRRWGDNPCDRTIPERTLEQLEDYRDSGIAPDAGSFLHAVLCNDLGNAIHRADKDSLYALSAICNWIHFELRSGGHGSIERIAVWVDAHKAR